MAQKRAAPRTSSSRPWRASTAPAKAPQAAVAQLGEPELLVGDQPPAHAQVGAALGVEGGGVEPPQLGGEGLQLGAAASHRRVADVAEDAVEAVVAALPAGRRAGGEALGDGALGEGGEAIVGLGHGGRV
jgi:hypothetical protein